MDPELILFDEPTSALDPSLALEVLEVIASIARKGTSMVIVTHEMESAKDISTRVIYLDQGIVYEEGSSSDIFLHPKKEKTKQFIFHIQTWNYDIESAVYDYADFNQSLHNFLYSHRVEARKLYITLQLCDEAINEILLKCIDVNRFHIHVTVEIIQSKKEIAIHFDYTGGIMEAYKKLHRKNKLPDLIISRFAKSSSKTKYKKDFTLLIK